MLIVKQTEGTRRREGRGGYGLLRCQAGLGCIWQAVRMQREGAARHLGRKTHCPQRPIALTPSRHLHTKNKLRAYHAELPAGVEQQ